MSWMPEPEPTPLRLRLGPRSEVPLPPAFEDAQSFDLAQDIDAPIESASAQMPESAPELAEPVEARDPLRAAASEELNAQAESALSVVRQLEGLVGGAGDTPAPAVAPPSTTRHSRRDDLRRAA